MNFTFKDATFNLPASWQQLEKDEQRAVYGGGDSILMFQYFPLAKPPSVPEVDTMMQAFSKDNKVEFTHEDANVGGAPARVATSRLNDNRLQLSAVIPRSSGILAMIGMGPDDDTPLQTFKGALASLSFSSTGVKVETPLMYRYHHADLKFSIGVPEGWEVVESENFPMHIFAPEEQGYPASLAFALVTGDEPIDMVTVGKYLQQQASERLDGFSLEQEQRLLLGAKEAYMVRYYWNGQDLSFSQLDTFISQEATRVVRVHGYSLRALEAKYITLFVQMLLTIEFDGND